MNQLTINLIEFLTRLKNENHDLRTQCDEMIVQLLNMLKKDMDKVEEHLNSMTSKLVK